MSAVENVEKNLTGSLVNVESNLTGSLVNVEQNLSNLLINVENNVLNTLHPNRKKMSLVGAFGPGFPGLGTNNEKFVDNLNKMGSMFDATYQAAGTYEGNPFELVSKGEKNAYLSFDYYYSGIDPSFSFFTTVPGGMTAEEHAAWIYNGGGQELWDEVSAKYNLKSFLVGTSGFQAGYWSNKKLDTLDDFKGAKIRQPGNGGKVLKRLGAEVSSQGGSELYNLLESGELDATEWVGPWNDYFMKFYKVTKYYYYASVGEPNAMAVLSFNLDYWNSLSKEQQFVIQKFAEAQTLNSISEYFYNNSKYLEKIKELAPDLQIKQFSPQTQTVFFIEAYEYLQEYVQKADDELTTKIWNNYKNLLNTYVAWGNINTYYIQSRNDMLPLQVDKSLVIEPENTEDKEKY